MPWLAPDREKIRTALSLPANRTTLDAIALGMDWLTANYPEGIATVQAKLSKLDALNTTLEGIYGDANFALIKADVLSWSEGSRASGVESLRSRLISEIAIALQLDLDLLSGSSGGCGGWGSGQLLRS